MRCRFLALAFSIFGWLACGGGGTVPSPADAAPPPASDAGGAQVPPMGQAAIEPWLAAGIYKTWRCETSIYPMRLNGAHNRHRICSNDLIYAAGPALPVGATSVKELYDAMDRPFGYAVGIKIAPGEGDSTWYWYERIGRLAILQPVADGVGVRECGPNCHRAAPRDNVFLRAP